VTQFEETVQLTSSSVQWPDVYFAHAGCIVPNRAGDSITQASGWHKKLDDFVCKRSRGETLKCVPCSCEFL
jgi:hypothetical protein